MAFENIRYIQLIPAAYLKAVSLDTDILPVCDDIMVDKAHGKRAEQLPDLHRHTFILIRRRKRAAGMIMRQNRIGRR